MKQPKIRLKGFEGEWKSLPFKQIFIFLKNNTLTRAELDSSKGCIKNVHYGDVLIKFGELLDLSQENLPFIKDSAAISNISKEYQLCNGDIIFADAAEDNTVGKCSEIRGIIKSEKVVSGLHTIPCRPNICFVEGFLGYYLNSSCYHNQLLPHIQGTKISSISKKALSSTLLSFTNNSEEQKAIANYFKSLDSLIQTTTKKIASLKQLKSASLVSMFPQEGETKPRVRFKGFDGEWKKSKLGQLFSERIENNIYGEMLSVTMNNGIIKAAENGRYDNSNSDKSHYKLVKVNDIAYNSMRMWQGASGCSEFEGIVSPAYTVVTPKEGVDSHFFACLFKTQLIIQKFRVHSQGLTSDTWNLKYPAFSKISVLFPSNIKEQQKIASFFSNLEQQISIQEQRLEKLKQIKSACLDKMFV